MDWEGIIKGTTPKLARKKIEIPDFLGAISKIPDHDRRTIRGASCGSVIPKTTLHQMMKSNVLHKQNVHCKPFLKELNKVQRVEYILKHISHEGLLDNFYSEVHIDEKWFYLHKVKRGIILHPDEPKRVQKCQSKRFVPKIMFMAAVARPRFDQEKKSWFDGLIGIFPFTKIKAAERSSYRRTYQFCSKRVTRISYSLMDKADQNAESDCGVNAA